MYLQYTHLLKQTPSQTRFKKFIEDADINELCDMVLKVLDTTEVISMLDNILQGFYFLTRQQDKRQKFIKKVLDALKKINVCSQHVDNVITNIAAHFSNFDKIHLTKLVDYSIDRIRNNDDNFMSWKDLLPILVDKLEEEKSINYRGTNLSSQEYKITIIRLICDIDWDLKIITSVAKMFVELSIDIQDESIFEMIMKALTNKLMILDFNELPPLVHQMLKLGYNKSGILLFSTLSKYFAEKYACISNDINSQVAHNSITSSKITLEEIHKIESTVLYYIRESILDDATGSTAYFRCLKSVTNAPEYVLDTFAMSALLLLSDVYEDQTLQILKIAFFRQLQDEEYQNNSAWIRHVLCNKSCALEIINQIIERSNKDRQLILKSIVDFAYVLLSTERKAGSENPLSWDYGSKILFQIAKKRHDAAGTILELLVNNIVQGGCNTIQYTDCLAYMCRRLSVTVLDYQTWISVLLDQLLLMAGSTAYQILKAILPLIRVSISIRDNLVMILRKALYRKGTQTRKMAVLGFLQLLKNLKLTSLTALSQSESFSCSNIGSSSSLFTQAILERTLQNLTSNPWHNTCLCREMLAILSKCFTHEIEVRSHLYKELYYGIVKNQELTEYIIEMLLEHFFKYYNKDEDVLPPIIFEKCSSCQGSDMILQEPLSDLIISLQKIYLKVASRDSKKIDKLANVLESLCKRMSQMDLEHMDIDENTDLLDNSLKAQQKLLNIKIAISVYESLIVYRIASWCFNSIDIGQSIISLYKAYLRLVEYVKKLGKSKKGGSKSKKDKIKNATEMSIKKSGRACNIKLLNTVMDFDIISKSIVLLYDQSNSWATPDQTSGIRGRVEFHMYILQTCLWLLQNTKTLKDHELKDYLELNKPYFITIGETLYKFIISDLKSVSIFNEQIAGLGAECFKECCDVMCTLNSSELPIFLEAICGVNVAKGLSLQLQELISLLKDIFIINLNEEMTEEMLAQKLPVHLIETIFKLVQKLTFSQLDVDKSFTWLNNIMENQEHIDVQIASKVSQLILYIEEQSVEYGNIIQDICIEFCSILGRINKVDITTMRKFQMINETNVHAIYIVINKILSSKLQNVNWLLSRLNADHKVLTKLKAESEFNHNKIKDKELALCRQFSFIICIFEILASIKIIPGQASDIIFKNLQKVYSVASSLIKYFRKKSTPTNPAFQAVKLIPVIQGAGNALKQAITLLILHIEASQNSGKSNDANVQRNKILKEVMVIPGVVQAMDTFDKEIILLSNKTKIDLTKYIKYDAVRDFRIQNSQLMENLEKMNVSLLITQTNCSSKKSNLTCEGSDNQSDSDVSPAKKRNF